MPDPNVPIEELKDGHLAELPAHARERLQAMRGTGAARALFTSDLSVNEFLLVKETGFDPVGLVMGSSIYHAGYQRGRWSKNEEMTVLTQALYHARELAMARMEEEAAVLDADGVIGVRLDVKRHAWGEDVLEFMAVGTAVAYRGGPAYRTHQGKPFTSDLSGQDFWTLLRAGYRPTGLVMGNCVYHVAHQGLGAWMRQVGRNCEMPNFTQALYDARELAMERMQAEAVALASAGVVGTEIREHTHGGWDAHVIEFLALGTAVVPFSAEHAIPAPTLVLTVNG
ncbi:MAG: heavy metal-binding domain-containing protein [Myxococcales bacterium]|nr:heavy metal-binding domain-containing protein [Myxococcales bacterium]